MSSSSTKALSIEAESALNSTRTRIGGALVTMCAALVLTGCSSNSATSSLATTISNGSAAAQTASFDLVLTLEGKTTSGVGGTALDDALKNLQQVDSTLGQSQPTAQLDAEAVRALALVRQAEDVTRRAQAVLSGRKSSTSMKGLATSLQRTSRSLSVLGTALKAKS